MCNFYDAYYPPATLGYLFGAKLNLPKDFQGRYKTSPTNFAPIVRVNEDGERVLEASHFKLIPSFVKRRTINIPL